MQVIINIPDRIYKRQGYLNNIDSAILRHALKDGKPLPKGHGRLIDAEVLDKLLEYLVKYTYTGSDIPCEYLNGSNYCCENCKYDNPVKECWLKYAEAEVRAESED